MVEAPDMTSPAWEPNRRLRELAVDRRGADWQLSALAVEIDNLDFFVNQSGLIADAHVGGLIEAGKAMADQVAKIPAASLSGVLAKARVVDFLYGLGGVPDGGDPDDTTLEKLHGAIVRDILQMMGGET